MYLKERCNRHCFALWLSHWGRAWRLATGIKITDSMARQLAPQDGALAERVEKRFDGAGHPPVVISTAEDAPFDQKVVDAMVAAVDARIHEYDARVERRIRVCEARVAVEMLSLDRRYDGRIQHVADAAARSYADEKVAGQVEALRSQVILLHQEFAEAVGAIVRDEVARQMEARAAALERSIREQILAATRAAAIETRSRAASNPARRRNNGAGRKPVPDAETPQPVTS
jgi:hypothetical protein